MDYVCTVHSASQRKKETDRGNLRSCPHVLLSHTAGLRWRQTLPAAERGTSVFCIYLQQDGGWGGCSIVHKCKRMSIYHKTQLNGVVHFRQNINQSSLWTQSLQHRKTDTTCTLKTHWWSLRPHRHMGNLFFLNIQWKTDRSAHWNQCQTPGQSSLSKDSWEHIRHASSWMSFQTQARKLKSHSGPHGSPALEGYITVSRNSDGFLSKKVGGGMTCFN